MTDNDTIIDIYENLFDTALAVNSKINVGSGFHNQVKIIDNILGNDVSGMVGTITDFMVQSSCVPMHFESANSTLNNIFSGWQENLNADINIDIPRGFRSFSEQYFRERWRSSFIVLNIEWGKIDGYTMPIRMWFSDGKAIYADRKDDNLIVTKYYLGKKKSNNSLSNTTSKSYIIRKPYNSWADLYPTPYLTKKGAVYHTLFKKMILEKQAQGASQAFPAMLAIKMGSQIAMQRGEMPSPKEMKDLQEKFIDLKSNSKNRTLNNGLVGAFPFDVNFENLLPDFAKILDEKILSGIDRNLLMSLGMIEFKGFSTTREEAVLNPKPLISEIEDAVEDFVELIDDVVYEIQKKNSGARKFSNKDISISVDPIKGILTDKMKDLIRSLYDRGLVCKEDTVEGLTRFKFKRQVQKRKKESRDGIEDTMFAPVILNQDNKERQDSNKNNPDDVKAIVSALDDNKKEVFLLAYNDSKEICSNLDYDKDFSEKVSIEIGLKAVESCLKEKYTKSNYPSELKDIPVGARNIWIKSYNEIYEETNDEDQATKGSWKNVKLKYKKAGDKWTRKKKS